MKVTVKSQFCLCTSKLKNMHKKSEETVCRMEENHRFQNICPLELTQRLKYTCEHIRFGKKTYKLITVTEGTKICSCRYHDNILENVHGHQNNSH